jgi:endonuclease YncB( thermonuclease family)
VLIRRQIKDARADSAGRWTTLARPVRSLFLTLLVSLATALAIAPAAIAKPHRGPCLPGHAKSPTCWLWTGKATFIADGDTINVDIDGDGTSHPQVIRSIGLNSTELHIYSTHASRRRGECHGVPAANEMERLVRASHWRVRLSAMSLYDRPGPRIRRGIQVRVNGQWRDTGEILVGRGDALWMPSVGEWWTGGYSLLAQQAAAARRGIFDRKQCGHAPEPWAKLRLRVIWDGTAGDLNGEFIEVTNDTTRPVNVGRWWLRDSFVYKYFLPRGTVIPPGGRLRLHTGHGKRRGNEFFWNYSSPLFGFEGDGGYLFDPRSNLRAWMQYPCRVDCVDPLQGKIRLTASPGGNDEYVLLRNISAAPVDLGEYALGLPFHAYEFGANSVLDPGRTLRVDVQGDPNRSTPMRRFYGYNRPLLSDGGQRVVLRSYSDVIVACDAWGSFSC